MSTFVAIDFETANYPPDSACAIGLVRVQHGQVVSQELHLIRPPERTFRFTSIHGLRWEDVERSPDFGELWPKIEETLEGADFFAAHNAGFDRRVLEACCKTYRLSPPSSQFLCTVQLARSAWQIFPTKLPNVCEVLGIELRHHEALSDALACAKIVMQAEKEGKLPSVHRRKPNQKLRKRPSLNQTSRVTRLNEKGLPNEI